MDQHTFTRAVSTELGTELVSARIAEQRRQDAQMVCEECGDVQADYRDDVEQHMCLDCYVEIPTADSDDNHNCPRGEVR